MPSSGVAGPEREEPKRFWLAIDEKEALRRGLSVWFLLFASHLKSLVIEKTF